MPHKSFSELQADLDQFKQKIQIDGIYSHYKHPENLYIVHSLAIQEATNNVCVIYEPQYHPGMVFVRDADNWLAIVEVDGKPVQRFRLVEKN